MTLPPHVPTAFGTTLAQQQQRALEAMVGGALDRDDVEMDTDGADPNLTSNPTHPWNATWAPGMASSRSLSGSSCASSSMPTTPLDLPYNEQWMPNGTAQAVPVGQQQQQHKAAYPSSSNPTSFTDMNGATTFFSSSPPLSLYPPPPPTPTGGSFTHSNPMDALPFPTHAWSAMHGHQQQQQQQQQAQSPTKASGVLRMEPSMGAGAAVPQDEAVRELELPVYGWDVPRQASTLNMGSHMI